MLGCPRFSEPTGGLVTWCLLVRTEQGAGSAARHAPSAAAWATLPHHLPYPQRHHSRPYNHRSHGKNCGPNDCNVVRSVTIAGVMAASDLDDGTDAWPVTKACLRGHRRDTAAAVERAYHAIRTRSKPTAKPWMTGRPTSHLTPATTVDCLTSPSPQSAP